MFLGKRPRPGVRFYVFLFMTLCLVYPLWQTYRAAASIAFPQKEQYAVVVQCINPMLEECDMIIKAVRNHEKFYIPNHSVRESHEKRECFNQPNFSGCSWFMDGDELPKENPDGNDNNVISYLPDELMEAYEQSDRRPDFWFTYDRGMGLNVGREITLSHSPRPILGVGVVSRLSGGYTFDALTNHLSERDAVGIVEHVANKMNANHYGVVHRAVCGRFSKPERTPAQKGYSEWPLQHPHCGGLSKSVRSVEENKFCLTWGKPEEDVYVKACKPQFAWLKTWTVSITNFKWEDPGPRLSSYHAQEMVKEENDRFARAAGVDYLAAIGVEEDDIASFSKDWLRHLPGALMLEFEPWEKTDEGWLSSASYVYSKTDTKGRAHFSIKKDGDICIHYNVSSVEKAPDRPCDHRKDF